MASTLLSLFPHVSDPRRGQGKIYPLAGLSHLTDDGSCEVVGPSGAFSFSSDRDFGSGAFENVEGEFSEDGEVFWAVILSVAGAILVESHGEDPMETVFD